MPADDSNSNVESTHRAADSFSNDLDDWLRQKHESFRDKMEALGMNVTTDLVGCDLSGMDFIDEDLSEINFTRCNLRKCAFIASEISNCQFISTELEYAVFDDIRGSHADFSDASLSMARFTRVDLVLAKWDDANFKGAVVDHNSIADWRLSKAQISDIYSASDFGQTSLFGEEVNKFLSSSGYGQALGNWDERFSELVEELLKKKAQHRVTLRHIDDGVAIVDFWPFAETGGYQGGLRRKPRRGKASGISDLPQNASIVFLGPNMIKFRGE